MYERYDNHCKYFGIVSKLTKNPLKRRTGIAVTGPTNTATCTFCTANYSPSRLDTELTYLTSNNIQFTSLTIRVFVYSCIFTIIVISF